MNEPERKKDGISPDEAYKQRKIDAHIDELADKARREEESQLPDVQAREDDRKWSIDKVGVKDVKWPIKLKDKNKVTQNTVAKFNMYVSLPKTQKGTHMSRFIEVLAAYANEAKYFDMDTMAKEIVPFLMEKMQAEYVCIDCEFIYFVDVTSPESAITSKLPVKCAFTVDKHNSMGAERYIEVTVPVTTVCPCSAEMSKTPHNQRGYVRIAVHLRDFIWIEDLVCVAMKEGSCQIYPLLKRPDEKWVMDKAGQNPKFVEDVVRDVAEILSHDENIESFYVECENHESIHPHNAYAEIHHYNTVRKKDGKPTG